MRRGHGVGILVTVLAATALGGWLGVQRAAARVIAPALQQALIVRAGPSARFRDVRLSPWGALVVRDLTIVPRPALRVTISRAILTPSWQDLWRRRTVTVRRVMLRGVSIAQGAEPPWLTAGRLSAAWTPEQLIVHQAAATVHGVPVAARGAVRGAAVTGQLTLPRQPPIPLSAQVTRHADGLLFSDLQLGAISAPSGGITWSSQRWSLTFAAPGGGTVTVGGGPLTADGPRGDIVCRGIRLGPVTLSTVAEVAAAAVPVSGRWGGTIVTRGTRVNQQPVGELSGAWHLAPEALRVESLQVGRHLTVAGTLGLRAPYPIRATVALAAVPVERVAALVEPGKPPLAAGRVDGRLVFTGPLASPRLAGSLTGRDGKFGRTPFETATINVTGEGSQIRVWDSRLRQPGGVVAVDGTLDVARLGTATVFEQIRLTPHAAEPSWQPPVAASVPDRKAAGRRRAAGEVLAAAEPAEEPE